MAIHCDNVVAALNLKRKKNNISRNKIIMQTSHIFRSTPHTVSWNSLCMFQSPHKFTHSIIPYTRNIFISFYFFARVKADLPICFLPAIIEKYNNNQHRKMVYVQIYEYLPNYVTRACMRERESVGWLM